MKNGYLLVNKPPGLTSFGVVKRIGQIYKTQKVGHVGTLDPFATGLLIVLVNKATKISQLMTNYNKEYCVKSKFGIRTDTGDRTGKIICEESNRHLTQESFTKIIPHILMLQKQIPSNYSAIKVGGQKSYLRARKGEIFTLPERQIQINQFTLLSFEYPIFEWKATVSKGTYVRTLSEQIADLCGTCAVTLELHRSKIGLFDVENSINFNDINSLTPLKPMNELLNGIPQISLNHFEKNKFLHGLQVTFDIEMIETPSGKDSRIANSNDQIVLVEHENEFLGLGKVVFPTANSTISPTSFLLKPYKVFMENE